MEISYTYSHQSLNDVEKHQKVVYNQVVARDYTDPKLSGE